MDMSVVMGIVADIEPSCHLLNGDAYTIPSGTDYHRKGRHANYDCKHC